MNRNGHGGDGHQVAEKTTWAITCECGRRWTIGGQHIAGATVNDEGAAWLAQQYNNHVALMNAGRETRD